MSYHCHRALAPNPCISTRSCRVGFGNLGTQQCITVPSPRSVRVDRRPKLLNPDLRHQFLDAVKLKHLDITNANTNTNANTDSLQFYTITDTRKRGPKSKLNCLKIGFCFLFVWQGGSHEVSFLNRIIILTR